MRQFKNTTSITDRSSTSMSTYLRDINTYPLISIEEEVELARLIRRGGIESEKAKKKLIEANLRFVVSIANQFHTKNFEISDLVSEGNIGLVKAAERFDDTKGFKFISYAVWWIRQSIMAAIAENGRIIRLPINQQASIQLYNQLAVETMQTEQRKPTAEEFAAFADIDVEKARMLIEANMSTVSADSSIGHEDEDTSVGDLLSSDSRTDSHADEESLHEDLVRTMSAILQPREREIVMRSFGINGKEESLEVIGSSMGLTRERVRQIRERAIDKMHEESRLLYRYLG